MSPCKACILTVLDVGPVCTDLWERTVADTMATTKARRDSLCATTLLIGQSQLGTWWIDMYLCRKIPLQAMTQAGTIVLISQSIHQSIHPFHSLVYWGLTPQQLPGSNQGGEMMMSTPNRTRIEQTWKDFHSFPNLIIWMIIRAEQSFGKMCVSNNRRKDSTI